MSAVGAVQEREERPATVRFETRAVENKQGSLEAGHWVGKEVDYALINAPYSRDVVEMKVESWFRNLDFDVMNGRLRPEWRDGYKAKYRAWKDGAELPPEGTPIKTWPVLSPAQVKHLLSINILTVEDLAGINGEGAQRIGMGAIDLKNKAAAWLSQAKDKGPLTIENAELKKRVASLEADVSAIAEQNRKLLARLEGSVAAAPAVVSSTITADDIMPEVEQRASTKKR